MNNKAGNILVIFFWLSFLFVSRTEIYAQSAQEVFGKNRVQYQVFDWKIISTDNYDIYYYKESMEAAYLAARFAEYEYGRITDLIGFAPYGKVKLLIYANHSDLLQSNLGLANSTIFIGGQTVFQKSRVEIAYNGVALDFKRDITKGIATLALTEMLYGGNFKDVLQSSYFLTLPEWFISGVAAYTAEGWSAEMDDRIRDIFANQRIKRPQKYTGTDAVLIGHSIFNFIAERFGKSNIANILNYTRIYRSEEKALSYALNMSYHDFLKEWKSFYQEQTNLALDNFTMPDRKLEISHVRKRMYLGKVRLSPDGKKLCYVVNDRGRYNVLIKEVESGADWVIYRGGSRQVEQKISYDLPVVSWQSDNNIGIISMKGDKLNLVQVKVKQSKSILNRLIGEVFHAFGINLTGHISRQNLDRSFKQVMDVDFSDDGNYAVFSAERGGQSDIYVYNLRGNRITQITSDFYDDLNPRFVPGSNYAFLFSSNRSQDSIRTANKGAFYSVEDSRDIYLYNPDSSKAKFFRLTNSGLYTESFPALSKTRELLYLSDENGITGLCSKNIGGGTFRILTGYRQNMQSYDINVGQKLLVYSMESNGRKRLFLEKNFDFEKDMSIAKTVRQEIIDERMSFNAGLTGQKKAVILKDTSSKTQGKSNLPAKTPPADTMAKDEIDTEFYVFEFEKNAKPKTTADKSVVVTKKQKGKEKKRPTDIYISSAIPYLHDFAIDNVVSTIRIDPLRGLGLVGEINMSDFLGNHRFTTGAFAAFDFRTSIMYGEYQYLKHRVDMRAKYTKNVLYLNYDVLERYSLHKAEIGFSYPINPKSRISFTPFYSFLSFSNLKYLSTPDVNTSFVGYNAEFVFDNTRSMGINIQEGTRIKIGREQYHATSDPSQSFSRYYMDIRNYTKIHKVLIWANRLSAGSFGGPAAKSFMIGGMDNWWQNKSNFAPPLDVNTTNDTKNLSYLMFNQFVTNLRGFAYNTFSGSNFVLLNSEIRLPVVRYLYQGSINSEFARNFQVLGFYDIGSAWTGPNPITGNNSYNIRTVSQAPFSIEVKNYLNPFLYSYGFGARSMVFGYFLKLDVAWGVRDYVRQPVMYYVTMGYDF